MQGPGLKERLRRSLRLRCPQCGEGQLFSGWFRMRPSCRCCKLDFAREPGFYLGSIYFNYGLTVLLVAPVYVWLTLGLDYTRDIVLTGCIGFSVLFPLWFFRYARSLWLGLMFRFGTSALNSGRASMTSPVPTPNRGPSPGSTPAHRESQSHDPATV